MQTDRVGLVGRVRAGNGRGDGSVAAVWKRSTANWHLEVGGTLYFAECIGTVHRRSTGFLTFFGVLLVWLIVIRWISL